MNSDILEGRWREIKGKVQTKWARLNNEDMDEIGGKREELIGRIQRRYGQERDAISRELDEFLSKL